jgi:hypothetical protein
MAMPCPLRIQNAARGHGGQSSCAENARTPTPWAATTNNEQPRNEHTIRGPQGGCWRESLTASQKTMRVIRLTWRFTKPSAPASKPSCGCRRSLKEIQARNDEGDFRFAFARTDLWRRGQESLPQPELQALKLLLDEWLQQHKDIATLLRLLSRSGPPAVTRDDMARGIAPFILRLAGDYSDVPIDEAFRRPRYTHLRTVFYEAADAIKALLERPQTGERT